MDISRCKVKNSFTAPLWLVFNNADRSAGVFPLIFKVGDDLRQDALTLQVIRFMDEMWKREGLDLHLSPYQVTPTGKIAGFIEVVRNTTSMAHIQKAAGGATAAVLSKSGLSKWLKQNNPNSNFSFSIFFSSSSFC